MSAAALQQASAVATARTGATQMPQVEELLPEEHLDVLAYFEDEPRSSIHPVTAIARDRKGRYVLIECAGAALLKIGARVTQAEARDLAAQVLAGGAHAITHPTTLFKLALALAGDHAAETHLAGARAL